MLSGFVLVFWGLLIGLFVKDKSVKFIAFGLAGLAFLGTVARRNQA